jgi:glyoxylase-like metal-dependent hydrolase (beta-lactamase superfamily II)
MNTPPELQQIAPNLFFWQSYDRQLKADLCSSAIATPEGIFMVDPIQLTDDALDQLQQTGPVAGVIVTNGNHLRASGHFSSLFEVPIFMHRQSSPDSGSPHVTVVDDGSDISAALTVIAIEGAAPGELVLYSSEHGGALIVGDALINFDPYGFAFLPRKYCSDHKQMRRSLRKLLACRFEKILFAHGAPILAHGSGRLQQLLEAAV